MTELGTKDDDTRSSERRKEIRLGRTVGEADTYCIVLY